MDCCSNPQAKWRICCCCRWGISDEMMGCLCGLSGVSSKCWVRFSQMGPSCGQVNACSSVSMSRGQWGQYGGGGTVAIAFLIACVGSRFDKILSINLVVLFLVLTFGGQRMWVARRQQRDQGVRGNAALSWNVQEVLACTTVLVVWMGSLSMTVEFNDGR